MKKITRREMLKLAGLASAGTVLVACQPAAPTTAPEAPKPADTKAPEAAKPADTAAPQPTTAAPEKSAVKITMVESWFGVPQYKESLQPVIDAINSKMKADGVGVEFASMILEDHENKYPLLYASGADFTMAFDAPWYKMTTLRDQGALSPLEDMVSKADKLMAEITQKIYDKNFMNGHLYGVPAAYYYGGTGGAIWREDLRQKYNAAMPDGAAGWASFEPFLEAILKNEKGMTPFANVTTQSITGYNPNRHAWALGINKVGVQVLDVTSGDFTIVDMETNQDYIDTAKLVNDWWKKGYINKTDLTFSGSSQNAQVDYIYPGKAAACVENEPDYKWVDESKQMKSSDPNASLMGMDMLGQIAGKRKGLGALLQWNFVVFNQAASAEQKQAGVDYFNWLASSQDNLDLWLMGVDGVNYKKEDNLRFSEIEGVDAARNYRRQWYVSGMSGRFQRQPKDLPTSAETALKFFSTEENWVFNPYETFVPDTKALEVDITKLNAVYDESVHGLDTGQEDTEAAKAKMAKMLDEAGRQEFKKKLQDQLDKYIAEHKA